MADLSDLQAAQTVKLTGASSTGTEQGWISSASNGLAGNQLLHVQTPDTTLATASLNALNANISIPLTGLPGVGFQLAAGTLIGTIVPESSVDGGTTWVTTSFIDSSSNSTVSSIVFATSNTLKILAVLPLNGASHVRVRVSAYTSGTATATLRASMARGSGQSISTAQIVSSLPAAQYSKDIFINSGVTIYSTYTASQNLAVKQFYAAGSGIGHQTLARYSSSAIQFVSFGDFESVGDVSNWPYYSFGGGGSATRSYSTLQAFTGTGSCQVVFTSSAANNSNGIRQTFSSVQNFSVWRYVSAQFYNTLSAGGAYTRTISIVLADTAGNTRKYDVSGLSTAAPFNASGWIEILREIENPTSTTGTGFDPTQVASIELRQIDSANKSGTIYWDTVRVSGKITPVVPVFHQAYTSFNVNIDPVVVLSSGDQIIVSQSNNDTARKEYYFLVGGVAL